jgi:DnaK suppressor protein
MRYLTQEQRDALRQQLEARAFALRGEIGDDARADLNAEPEMAALARDVAELRDVEQALAALARPDFGLCAACGNVIPYSRLQANPSAARCVACQEQLERSQGAPAS